MVGHGSDKNVNICCTVTIEVKVADLGAVVEVLFAGAQLVEGLFCTINYAVL